MFLVIAGTSRPGARSLTVARLVAGLVETAGAEAELLDLGALPPELFRPEAYAEKPTAFERFQRAVLEAEGILTVVPEYNGSYPGVLKHFIDMLRFPESLRGKPAAFVGIAAGEWGGLRAVEQLEMVFQYRSAHLYGRRVFLRRVHELLDGEGRLTDPELAARLERMVHGFVRFARALGAGRTGGADG